MDFQITTYDKISLLYIARQTIASHLFKTSADISPYSRNLDTQCGAFVTLNKNKQLRGCIGNLIGTKPLAATIKEMAIAAAFNDPRFRPVEKNEFEDIVIEISVLSPLKKIESESEIKIGVHGIYLVNSFYGGTFLPQVAPEQGWNVKELLENVCIKAGLPKDAYKEKKSEIYIYSAAVFSENALFET